MKKSILSMLLVLALVPVQAFAAEAEPLADTQETAAVLDAVAPVPQTDALQQQGTFQWNSGFATSDDKKLTYDYSYDESWFFGSASSYQAELAAMSLRLSMAAYGDLQSGASNVQALLEDLQFQNISANYPTPSTNSIGYILGSKNIVSASGQKEALVVVAIRGGGYGAEWGGNFNVGSYGDHAGFTAAANQVMTGLEEYLTLSKDVLNSNVKIWITGYSRGAAAANLVAARLDDGELSGIDSGDVYAYCFECPKNTISTNAHNSRYNNIKNIVNPIDLVPYVGMAAWGFDRYGQTLYLPSQETSDNYDVLHSAMEAEYLALVEANAGSTNDPFAQEYDPADEGIGQAQIMGGFIGSLAETMTRQDYAKSFQSFIMNAFSSALGQQNTNWNSLANQMDTLLKRAGIDTYETAQLKVLLGRGLLAYGHYAELCLSWVDSLGADLANCTEGKASTYRKVFVNGDVDVAVTDAGGNLRAEIWQGQANIPNDGVPAYLDNVGQKIFLLPAEGSYELSVTAANDGNVSYTVTEQSIGDGIMDSLISYYEVPVTAGQRLTASVGSGSYSFGSASASVRQSGSSIKAYTVTAAAGEGGSASGGGTVKNGLFTQVTATARSGWKFLGWYDESDALVSQEKVYRFLVKEDVTLTAKFEAIPEPEHPFTDVSADSPYYNAVVWAYKNTVTSGVSATEFGMDSTCTRGQVMTFLYAAKNRPGADLTQLAKFTDVAESDYYASPVAWAVANSVTSGTSATTFGPEDTCTRAHVITFLRAAMGKPEPSQIYTFTDMSATDWYAEPVSWAVEEGLIQPKADGSIGAEEPCPRKDIVQYLYKFLAE